MGSIGYSHPFYANVTLHNVSYGHFTYPLKAIYLYDFNGFVHFKGYSISFP